MDHPRLSTLTTAMDTDVRTGDLVRYAIAKHQSYDTSSLREAFHARRQLTTKAAVDPLTFADLDFAVASRAFLALVNRLSILGQLPAVTVSPAAGVGRLLTRPTGGWRGEGTPKACGGMTFDLTGLAPLTVAALTAASVEFVERKDVDATSIITSQLASALAGLTDAALLTPGNTGTAGVKPASILSGLSATVTNTSVGVCAGAALNAISDGAPERPVLVLSFTTALKNSALVRDLRELGVLVLISPAAGANTIAIDAARLAIAAGDASVSQSREANLVLDTVPEGSPAGLGTSLWQANLIGFKAERIINWIAGVNACAYSTVS